MNDSGKLIMNGKQWQVQRFVNSQIKYATVEQKLMVTVDRCEALKKESGIFGGDHNDENYDNDEE